VQKISPALQLPPLRAPKLEPPATSSTWPHEAIQCETLKPEENPRRHLHNRRSAPKIDGWKLLAALPRRFAPIRTTIGVLREGPREEMGHDETHAVTGLSASSLALLPSRNLQGRRSTQLQLRRASSGHHQEQRGRKHGAQGGRGNRHPEHL